MHALWNPSRFTGIIDYQTWEDALLDDDDITEHVRAGKLVPINIGGDGAFQFLVRVGTAGQAATLTGREKHHTSVQSCVIAGLVPARRRPDVPEPGSICATPLGMLRAGRPMGRAATTGPKTGGPGGVVQPRSNSLLVRGQTELQPYGSLTRNR
jgi:hypothetical protein